MESSESTRVEMNLFERRGTLCRRHAWALALLACGLSYLATSCGDRIDVRPAAAATSDTEGDRQSLVAMARLEPSSRVVDVGSPSSDIVRQILVREGDEVEKGQVLVLLESYSLRAAELEAARLERERAELKPFEVEAQRARVRAIEAELESAHHEVSSQRGLSEKGFSAGKEFRDAQLRVKRADEQLNEANAVLKKLEADVNLAEREARNGIVQAEAKLERTMIRAPLDGQILRVRFSEGERIDQRAVVSVGATQHMYAVGEVHANEIRLVEPGQRARFTSPALPTPVDGVVENVGAMIFGNYITGEDPSAPRGLRVVEVRVRLAENELAKRLTNLEGQLRIYLDDTAPR